MALMPALLGAQAISVSAPANQASALLLREASTRPHTVRTGPGRVDFRRDTTVTESIIVFARSATVASRVQGDVIVVGGDLFLHPGVEISGRAVAIGGTVANTTLGTVRGGVQSFRDETYDVTASGNAYALAHRALGEPAWTPSFGLAGVQGFLIPTYDRVNGLSLPVGVYATLGTIEVQPTITYRSRLGVLDPGVTLRAGSETGRHLEAFAGRATRSNDRWIYSDFVNSALSLFKGRDTRNYFRSRDVEARFYAPFAQPGRRVEAFVGARHEQVSPVSSSGNVWSLLSRKDVEDGMARPNPLVQSRNIGSVLVGGNVYDTSGVVTSRLRVELEQAVTSPQFFQATVDVRVGFPTFGAQRLELRGHGVATAGSDSVKARYAYLGGAGTIPTLELLELGGNQLVFLESRYLYPVTRIVLPFVGSPVLTLRHLIGGAGVGSLPALEQAIGVGVGLSAVRFDVTRDVTGSRGTKYGVGISLGH